MILLTAFVRHDSLRRTPTAYSARALARIFEVPIALVTFIDRNHQWFKSQVGLPEDIAEAQQTSRELSVCGHVIANDEVLGVEDLARDRRFANNSLLKERGLRFYAGVPLRSNNLAIGSLCVLDLKPRRMAEREKRLLEVIAEDVMEEIQRRDSVGSLSAVACHQESNPSASTK